MYVRQIQILEVIDVHRLLVHAHHEIFERILDEIEVLGLDGREVFEPPGFRLVGERLDAPRREQRPLVDETADEIGVPDGDGGFERVGGVQHEIEDVENAFDARIVDRLALYERYELLIELLDFRFGHTDIIQ